MNDPATMTSADGTTILTGYRFEGVLYAPDEETARARLRSSYMRAAVERATLVGTVHATPADPRTAFSVGETVIIRDTSDNLDAVGDITAIYCTEAGFQVSADVDVDGALHRVFLADVREIQAELRAADN